MDRESMHPPEYAGDQSDADLTVMLADAEARLLTAIQANLDLDAGLAEILGSPHLRTVGMDDAIAASPEERLIRTERPACASNVETPADSIQADSIEDRYHAVPGKPLHLRFATSLILTVAIIPAIAAAIAAIHASDSASNTNACEAGGSGITVCSIMPGGPGNASLPPPIQQSTDPVWDPAATPKRVIRFEPGTAAFIDPLAAEQALIPIAGSLASN